MDTSLYLHRKENYLFIYLGQRSWGWFSLATRQYSLISCQSFEHLARDQLLNCSDRDVIFVLHVRKLLYFQYSAQCKGLLVHVAYFLLHIMM